MLPETESSRDTAVFPRRDWTPIDAAQAYAWEHSKRKAWKFTNIPGKPLTIEFQLVNGVSWFQAEWDDEQDAYVITRLG